MRCHFLAILVASVITGFAGAADPPSAFECRWADTPIVIDGKGDDPAWKHAQVIDHFYLPWLRPALKASTATRAKLLWDREYLYFLAEMQDSDLQADPKAPDGAALKCDSFQIFIKPAADKPGYYQFHIDAAGTVRNLFLPRREAGGFPRRQAGDPTFHVDAKLTRNGTLNNPADRDTGWTVEGRIPWTDLLRTGGRPEPGEQWTFALCRSDFSAEAKEPEHATCAPLTGKSPPKSDRSHVVL